MKIYKQILSVFFLLSFHVAPAQEKILEGWHQSTPIEKVYLHMDRKDYFAGQTSWFKGYFISDFKPSARNSTLFVELINRAGAVISQKVLPVFNGITYGQIDIPDTLSTGTYQVRAYTPLMLNQEKVFLYNTPIRVHGRNNKPEVPSKNTHALAFFPEGGTLLAGVENKVAFKATSGEGLPENITASIVDNTGATVTQIESLHDGMGVFKLKPADGTTYQAVWNGKAYPLPVASGKGIAIQVENTSSTVNYSYTSSGDESFTPSYIIGQMQHEVMFKLPVNNNQPGTINTSALHSGILQITFFNKDGMPLAERLVFVDNKEYIVNAVLNPQQINTKVRGKNHYSIDFNEPVNGNFSVSVTDDDYNEPGLRKENIISSLLLTSDIPGYVHHPAFYFSSAPQAKEALDLVMLTNGWRRFNWKELIGSKPPTPGYTDPGYISLSGQVNVRGSKKNFADRDLLVWVATSDSGRALELVKTDAEGRFKMDSVVFFDKAKILFSDVMGNKSKFLTVKLDTDSLYRTFNLPALQMPPAINTGTSLLNNMQGAYSSYARGGGVLLDNVNIEGRRLTLEELEKKYVSGLFSGNINARTINLTGQFVPQINIFEWLIGRVPSLVVQRNSQFFDGYQLYLRQQPVQLFLDEMQMQDASLISTIPPNQIALIKIYPQFIGARGNGAAIAIYTKRGEDLNEEMEASGDIVDYDGYSIIKEFYSPDYSTPPDVDYRDNRLTLAWQPEVTVSSDKNASIPVQFYNTDRTKKFKVVAEGVTKEGKLLWVEQTVE
ncbi:hypothetical protein U0035_06175 [Niabella yanshanensis]|uniref:MG2 domain-containing protein n=1 Tax=Niabella yanshanensis TaxID=577386 RepID=A0ABZ0WB88_9BACT|nr:hypothetical protein [Niabella yanshanensis]WQD39732.1 hypothetical protein U0035_06175 [Niabella yanshanensis]